MRAKLKYQYLIILRETKFVYQTQRWTSQWSHPCLKLIIECYSWIIFSSSHPTIATCFVGENSAVDEEVTRTYLHGRNHCHGAGEVVLTRWETVAAAGTLATCSLWAWAAGAAEIYLRRHQSSSPLQRKRHCSISRVLLHLTARVPDTPAVRVLQHLLLLLLLRTRDVGGGEAHVGWSHHRQLVTAARHHTWAQTLLSWSWQQSSDCQSSVCPTVGNCLWFNVNFAAGHSSHNFQTLWHWATDHLLWWPW